MKSLKQAVCGVLAMVLALSLMAGCSGDPATTQSSGTSAGTGSTAGTSSESGEDVPELAAEYPAFAEKHTITVQAIEMGWTGPQEDVDFVTPELERRTNLKLVYEPITVSTYDDMNQKLNLMIASKEIPDVYMGLADSYTQEIYQRLGQNDMIWDLAPLLSKYENIYNLVEPELNMYREDSGASYFVPCQTGRGNDVMHTPPGGLHFRTDYLEQLDMEIPTTPEELYTYLVRCRDEIKESNGQTIIPLSFGENLSGIQWALLIPFFTDTMGTDISGLAYDTDDNYKVVNQEYTNSEQMMRACKFLNKLYQEKLLDNEILTHKDAQFREKASTGVVACLPGNYWDINAFTDAARTTIPELEYVYSRIYDKTNIPEENYQKPWTSRLGYYSSLIVSKDLDEATAEHFVAVLDYMATKEGQLLVQMGVEGISYEFDENGMAQYTEQFIEDTNNLDWNKQAAYGVAYLQQFVYNFPAYEDVIDSYPALEREDNVKSLANDFHLTYYDPTMEPTKDYYVVAGEQETKLMNAIYEAHDKLLVDVMLAANEAEVENLVNAYGEQCKALGIDDIVAERQAFVDNLDID